MPRHRDFTAARAEHDAEPITFTLDDAGPFRCVDGIPAGLLLDLVGALPDGAVDAAGKPNADVSLDAFRAFSAFLIGIVVDDDREAFRAALAETTFDTIAEVAAWAMEEISGRPLSPASSSEPSRSRSGPPSRPVSLAPVDPEARSA